MIGTQRGFFGLPPVVKNLIMINVFMSIADFTAYRAFGINLSEYLGLHFPKSELFRPIQILSHMFMHASLYVPGGFTHIFFNMFALFMFGRVLETVWGSKRFLIYYMVSGLGAALVHEAVIAVNYYKVMAVITPAELQTVLDQGYEYLSQNKIFTNETMRSLQLIRCSVWFTSCIRRPLPQYRTYASLSPNTYKGQVFCPWVWCNRTLSLNQTAGLFHCPCCTSWRDAIRVYPFKILEENH